MENQKHESSNKWLVLLVVVIGTFMSALDSSIVNIAISTLMSVFSTTLDNVKWVLTAYTLSLGVIIPLTGYLMERYDHKYIYIFALGTFTVGSFLCGLAWSNSTLIIFRVVQAIGGGMIMPVGMAIIYTLFPPSERGKAMGVWGISAMVAPAVGPTLGGWIIQTLSWRLLFYINVPIGILGVILAAILIKKGPVKAKIPFDYLGFISVAIGLICILYVLGEGSVINWSDLETQILMTTGCLSIVFFVINELTHENPLLELRIVKDYNFAICQLLSMITTVCIMGGMYVLPLFLQNVRGFSAMEAGMIMFPSAIATGIMLPLSGAISDKYGAKVVTIAGLIILGIGSYELTFISMDMSRESLIMITLVRGIGLGLCLSAPNVVGMSNVPRNLTGKASALSNTVRQVASAVVVTLMTSIIQNRLVLNYAKLSDQITPFNQTAVNYIKTITGVYVGSGLSSADAQVKAVTGIAGLIQKQAYIDAQVHAITVSSLAIIIGIILVLFLKEKKKSSKSKGDDSMGEEVHMVHMME